MASGPITSWQIDGETMETATDFIFLWFKITADDENTLAPWKKSNLDSILKTETLLSSQSYGFFQESCMDVRVGQ